MLSETMSHQIVTDCDSYMREITSSGIGLVSEVDIFGPASKLVNTTSSTPPQIIERLSLINSYGYHSLVVIIFVMFCYIIYSFRGSIMSLFKMIFTGASIDKKYQNQPLFFKQFINICSILGLLVISGIVVKLLSITGANDYISQQPPLIITLFPLIVLLLASVIWLYKIGARWLIANITQTELLFEEYKNMSRLLLVICYIIITPLFLLFALNSGYTAYILIYTSLFIYLALYVVYLIKSYRLFMERNIFIVQWILYLCAVELFPLSLLLFLVLRNI